MMPRKATLCLGVLLACATAGQASELQTCWKQSLPETQIANCSKVIDGKPSVDVLADALLHRASAYAAKGMVDKSIADYSRSLTIKPNNDQAFSGRAQSYLKARKFELAIADYSAAIKINAKLASAYVGRGYAYLVKKQPEKAIEDFTAALKVSPSYVAALNNRGLAHKEQNRLGSALADFTQAISINPLYALAYNNRGYLYEAVGDKATAIDDFRNALAIDPSLVGARDGLVRLSAAGNRTGWPRAVVGGRQHCRHEQQSHRRRQAVGTKELRLVPRDRCQGQEPEQARAVVRCHTQSPSDLVAARADHAGHRDATRCDAETVADRSGDRCPDRLYQ